MIYRSILISPLPLPHFSLFLMLFFPATNSHPSPQSKYNSTSHNKFDYYNTQFVSIHVLTQILLKILYFK